jgi:hypothetical protein
MITLRISCLLFVGALLSGVKLNAQPPDLTDVRYLPGDNQVGAAAGDQESPIIARGDNTFLQVWVDTRTDLVTNLVFR